MVFWVVCFRWLWSQYILYRIWYFYVCMPCFFKLLCAFMLLHIPKGIWGPLRYIKQYFFFCPQHASLCPTPTNCLWNEWVSLGSLLSRGWEEGEGVIVSDPGEQPGLPSCAQGIVPLKLSSVSGHLFVPVWFSLLSGGEHVCRPGHKEWPPSRSDQTHSILPMCVTEVLPKALLAGEECRAPAQQLGLSAPPSLPT